MKIINRVRKFASNTVQYVKNSGAVLAAGAVGVGSMVVSGVSQAAILAADLAPITTTVTADVATVATWAFGILALVLGTTIGFGLVKKFGSKSAS